MNKYYNIKEKKDPETYGIVVKVKEGKLEVITGEEEDIKKYGVRLINKGNLKVKKNYFYMQISKSKAYNLKRIETNLRMLQSLAMDSKDLGPSHLVGPNNEALY